MARFDNTLDGYIKAKVYLIERELFDGVIDDYAIIKLANKTVMDRKFLIACCVSGTLQRPNSIVTCDNSVTSDPTKCMASRSHSCKHKINPS